MEYSTQAPLGLPHARPVPVLKLQVCGYIHWKTMVGFIANLAHACLNGTKPHLVPAKVAWRYRLGMHLRCSHGDFGVLNSDDED